MKIGLMLAKLVVLAVVAFVIVRKAKDIELPETEDIVDGEPVGI